MSAIYPAFFSIALLAIVVYCFLAGVLRIRW